MPGNPNDIHGEPIKELFSVFGLNNGVPTMTTIDQVTADKFLNIVFNNEGVKSIDDGFACMINETLDLLESNPYCMVDELDLTDDYPKANFLIKALRVKIDEQLRKQEICQELISKQTESIIQESSKIVPAITTALPAIVDLTPIEIDEQEDDFGYFYPDLIDNESMIFNNY